MQHRGTILQRHSGDRLAGQRGQRQIYIRRVHLPLVSEIRDDSAHEGLDRGLRGGMVAEMIGQQRQCELARLGTLATPLEAVLAELHDVHARIERRAVDGDLDAVDGPVSPIMLHSALLSLSRFAPLPEYRYLRVGKTQGISSINASHYRSAPGALVAIP